MPRLRHKERHMNRLVVHTSAQMISYCNRDSRILLISQVYSSPWIMDCLNTRYYKDPDCCRNIVEIKSGTLQFW